MMMMSFMIISSQYYFLGLWRYVNVFMFWDTMSSERFVEAHFFWLELEFPLFLD